MYARTSYSKDTFSQKASNKRSFSTDEKRMGQCSHKDEKEALKQLIRLQKNRQWIIKSADKGGINGNPYFKEVPEKEFQNSKKEIKEVVNDGILNGFIDKDEFSCMNPEKKKAARFYEIFKIHKYHPKGSLAPGHPMISGNELNQIILTSIPWHWREDNCADTFFIYFAIYSVFQIDWCSTVQHGIRVQTALPNRVVKKEVKLFGSSTPFCERRKRF
ncbi:unnamed protein product [Lepeophtheirus salmonis]|uniref:(salmon louse) hypothetical protein n=1 Tax=Lepeophtheirus salmonis TaxID=72036 RepID=A0A7R8H5A2_LEPSM|nr:unnamed protein product [Lepeophtheirus salmonis]CAF2872981.1 unnamed protein product [Lepeophtheirus salmonis]